MKKAYIFGGGIYGKEFPVIGENDFVIAADKGFEILKNHKIEPDITVGDFDSSSEIPEKNVIKLPVEKDVTDTHAAVNIALEKGCEEIHIYGGTGGRPDHTFANYSLLAFLSEKGVRAYLVGEGHTVTAVTDGKVVLYGKVENTVSVFSWSDISEGVTLENLKYSLSNAVLSKDYSLGVSNSFVSEKAEISVKKGTLLIMWQTLC